MKVAKAQEHESSISSRLNMNLNRLLKYLFEGGNYLPLMFTSSEETSKTPQENMAQTSFRSVPGKGNPQ